MVKITENLKVPKTGTIKVANIPIGQYFKGIVLLENSEYSYFIKSTIYFIQSQ